MGRSFVFLSILFLLNTTLYSIEKIHKWKSEEDIHKLINYYKKNNNYDSSIYYVDQLIQLAKENKDENKIFSSYNQKIETLIHFNKSDEALKLSLDLNEKYCKNQKEKNCSICNHINKRMSGFMVMMEDYRKSINYLNEICDESKNVRFYYEKALLYVSLELNDSALLTTNYSIDKYKNSRPYDKIATYNQHGLIARKINNYSEAIKAFKTALKIIDSTNSRKVIRPIILGNLGSCYYKIGRKDTAYSYLLKDSEGSLKIGELNSHINAEINIAEIELEKNSYNKAKHRLLNLIENYNLDFNQKQQVLSMLADVSQKTGSNSNYFEYMNQWYELNIKEYKTKATKQQTLLKQYSSNSLEKAIQQMEIENELLEQKIYSMKIEEEKKELQSWLLISSLVIIILIIVFIFFRHRTINKKNKLIKESELKLAQKEQEFLALKVKKESENVQSLSLELGLKRDFSSDLINQIKSLESISKSDFKHIEQFIYNDLDIKSTRAELQEQMGDISSTFYNELKIKHPELTEKDLKLAAMIALNLSNKDIAISKNITPESVKIAKNRLKKKLDLSSNDNLKEYLSSSLPKK